MPAPLSMSMFATRKDYELALTKGLTMETDSIEFFEDKSKTPFLTVDSSFQPNDADLISIEGKTWEVIGRSFSVDYARTGNQRMRCNVIVKAKI